MKWKGRWRWSEKSFFQNVQKIYIFFVLFLFHCAVQMKRRGRTKRIRHTTVAWNKKKTVNGKEKIHVIVALNFSLIIGHVSSLSLFLCYLVSLCLLFFRFSLFFLYPLLFCFLVTLTIQCGNKTIFFCLNFCRQAVKIEGKEMKRPSVCDGLKQWQKTSNWHQMTAKNWKKRFSGEFLLGSTFEYTGKFLFMWIAWQHTIAVFRSMDMIFEKQACWMFFLTNFCQRIYFYCSKHDDKFIGYWMCTKDVSK